MANVQNKLKDFETRTGRSAEQTPLQPSTGLAGFTVTLIDSVTRLTTYVNEVCCFPANFFSLLIFQLKS